MKHMLMMVADGKWDKNQEGGNTMMMLVAAAEGEWPPGQRPVES